MKHILRNLALLLVPVLAYFCLFAAFEPNNYFGLHPNTDSDAPISRLKDFKRQPGNSIIIGDSRFAHFDMDLVEQTSGRPWQNLAFGGASLREGIDLLNWSLDNNPDLEEVIFGFSFYTINQGYDTDRMSNLEKTLNNPFAYFFNLEYNVNMLTNLQNQITGRVDAPETGDWVYPQDYIAADGTVYEVHTLLAEYPAALITKCENWALNTSQLDRLYEAAARCAERGVKLTVVLAPMADIVKTEVCDVYGEGGTITEQMETTVLPQLAEQSAELGFSVLDYEWTDRPDLDDDTQFYDGFHLDERYGLPQWTEQLFTDLG